MSEGELAILDVSDGVDGKDERLVGGFLIRRHVRDRIDVEREGIGSFFLSVAVRARLLGQFLPCDPPAIFCSFASMIVLNSRVQTSACLVGCVERA